METDLRRVRPYPATVAAFPGGRLPSPREEWELAIHGDLSDRESDLLTKLIELPRGSRGTIFFDSCGGSAYVGLALASVIRLRGLQPVGVVAGECSSAAILPFAACRERYVTSHATLLFHPIRWSSDEDLRMEEAAEWARHFQQLETDLDGLLVRMFEISEEQLAEWTRPGRFVTGPELAAAGLAKLVDLFSGDLWEQIAGGK
ncbi:MAG: ATP-dependent Clp protease proteolytic subunit [Planctomycetales bacterium]